MVGAEGNTRDEVGREERKGEEMILNPPFHEVVLPLVSERLETMALRDLSPYRIVLFLDRVVVTACCVQRIRLRSKVSESGWGKVRGEGGERIRTVGVEDTWFGESVGQDCLVYQSDREKRNAPVSVSPVL